MAEHAESFPFFMPVASRPLSPEERSVLEQLLRLSEASTEKVAQIEGLAVVGRCGCGKCPTVFFQEHEPGKREQDRVSAVGRDHEGGIVAAVLLEKNGSPSQLEFYSVDGHEPWGTPRASSLSLMPR